MLRPNEVLIHDGNAHLYTVPPAGQGMGLVPRDFAAYPVGGMEYAPQTAMAKIPRSEWPERIRDKVAQQSQLSDIRLTGLNGGPIPSRDQNGKGYCWAHSTVSAAILARARDNQPYADLSAYAIACIIKNYRDQGGWNGESMKFLAEKGCPTSEFWPQQSMSKSNDKPETWANAAQYKDMEWEDMTEGDFDMQATFALSNMPCPLDLNWWSHSICAMDLVDGVSSFNMGLMRTESGKLVTLAEFDIIWQPSIYQGAFGLRIWNSWGDSWSDRGMGTLTESKSKNNGSIALRVMRAAD